MSDKGDDGSNRGGDSVLERCWIEATYRHSFDQRLPLPEELFKLAQKDPLISTFIGAWRSGHCSWEAALVAIIVAQHQSNQKLLEHAMVAIDHSTRPFIVPDIGATKEEKEGGLGVIIKARGLTTLARYGRTVIVAAKVGFLCERWYRQIIVAVNHDKLAELILEGLQP